MSTAWVILVTGLSLVIVILLLLVFLGKDSDSKDVASLPDVVYEVPEQPAFVMGVETSPELTTDSVQASDLDEPLLFGGEVLAGSSSPLINFNESDYLTAIESDKLVVLYFFANWGPICKVELADALYPAFESIIDSNTVAFRVNFNDNQTDSFEKDLARKYAVSYQHTKIFVRDGEELLKTSEAWTKEFFLEEIAKYSAVEEYAITQ
jgi:thiol-disulfide isomerase/thioredoxin